MFRTSYNAVKKAYQARVDEAAEHGVDYEEIERYVMLRMVDQRWMDHIDNMDALRSGIGLKAYGQQDPVIAYQQEGFDMFDEMIEHIHEDVVMTLMRSQIKYNEPVQQPKQDMQMVASHGGSEPQERQPEVKTKAQQTGRNDPCPCGSGKKYKNCCGKDA